jgi:geranylgeranyl diphosphate synthase type II
VSPIPLQATLARDRKLIEAELARALKFDREVPRRLAQCMRYAVMGPGKRIRPILALEAFRAAGGRNVREVLPFCCGIEFIHTFSLIHDDLPSMDDDDFRRGRPSAHRKFGEAVAILAADGLFALAFEQFAQGPAPAGRKLAAQDFVCRAVGPAGMTGGQALDVETGAGRVGKLLVIQRKKTAEFISAAVVAGAILGGAGKRERERVRQAGLALGELFQVTDDLLDAGQASDGDKLTMVSVFGVEKTRMIAAANAERARRAFRAAGESYGLLAEVVLAVLAREE